LHNLVCHLIGDHGSVGSQGYGQVLICGMPGDTENVRPDERLPAAEHQDRFGKGGDIIHELDTFTGLHVSGSKPCAAYIQPSAVTAGQVAAGSGLPENEPKLVTQPSACAVTAHPVAPGVAVGCCCSVSVLPAFFIHIYIFLVIPKQSTVTMLKLQLHLIWTGVWVLSMKGGFRPKLPGKFLDLTSAQAG
jgi:hypothetical protein